MKRLGAFLAIPVAAAALSGCVYGGYGSASYAVRYDAAPVAYHATYAYDPFCHPYPYPYYPAHYASYATYGPPSLSVGFTYADVRRHHKAPHVSPRAPGATRVSSPTPRAPGVSRLLPLSPRERAAGVPGRNAYRR